MSSVMHYYPTPAIPMSVPQYNNMGCTTKMEFNNHLQQQQQFQSIENSTYVGKFEQQRVPVAKAFTSTSQNIPILLPNDKQLQPQQLKQKRSRTAFSSQQLSILESEFKRSNYLHRQPRKELARHLELHERQIKIWFQNRRMKIKKQLKVNNGQTNHIKDTGTSTEQNVHKGIVKRLMSYSQGNHTVQSNFVTSPKSGLITYTSAQEQNSTIENKNHFITPPDSSLQKPSPLDGYNKEPEVQNSISTSLPDLNNLLADLDSNCPMQSNTQISRNYFTSSSSTFQFPPISN